MGNWVSGSRSRVVGFGAVVVVGVCVVLAAPVLAYVARATKTVVVPKMARGEATAACPAGEHVEFGGVIAQLDKPIFSGAIIFPEGMRRTAPDRWTVYGQSSALTKGSNLTSVGYCGPGVAASVTRHSTSSVSALQEGSATATCPTGTVVTGGGFLTNGSKGHVELVGALERTAPTKWRVVIENLNDFTVSVSAIAYCGGGAAPTAHTNTVTLAANNGTIAHAKCPKGSTILFGGLIENSPVTSSSSGAAVAPFRWTAPTNEEWDVGGFNAGNRSGTLEAIAYCR